MPPKESMTLQSIDSRSYPGGAPGDAERCPFTA
jgi:hypothetical protein